MSHLSSFLGLDVRFILFYMLITVKEAGSEKKSQNLEAKNQLFFIKKP